MPGKTLQPEIATPTCLSPEEEPVPVLVHSESQPTAQSGKIIRSFIQLFNFPLALMQKCQ